MKTVHIVVIAVAAVLVTAIITGGLVYMGHQNTIRRHDCVQHSGTWVGGQCVAPISDAIAGGA